MTNDFIKRIGIYFLIAFVLFGVGFWINLNLIQHNGLPTQLPLLQVYLFHVLFSILIYVICELVYLALPAQVGYAFLASVFLKMGFFVLIFKNSLFGEVELAMFERVSLIVPLFLFLLLEAIALARLLNADKI